MSDPRLQPYIEKLQRGEELTTEELMDYKNIMNYIPKAPQDVPWEDTTPSTFSDAMKAAGQGVTFGFGDELLGGLGGLGNIFGEGGFSEGYTQTRDAIRKDLRQAQERSPTATTIGEVVGAVGSGLVTPQLLVGKIAGAVGGLGGKALGMAAQGAVEGAAYSAGKSEEAPTSLGFFEDMGEGALFGGLVGGSIPLVKPLASKAKSATTSTVSQLSRLKIFAGLEPFQANMYKEYLDDISKYATDVEGLKEAVKSISETSKDLKVIRDNANIFYEAAKNEVVPNPASTFMDIFNNIAKEQGIDKSVINETKSIQNLFGKILDLEGGVTGDVIHKLRKEADELIKWDRKNSLSVEAEQAVKAARNVLKEISSPSTKAGDMIYKAGIPIKQVKNQLIDKNGKPTGFLNRLEQGKLNEGEVNYIKDKFRTIGLALQNTVEDLKATGVKTEHLENLAETAEILMRRDMADQALFDKAYKFIEFQKTGSLRDLSKMVKIGAASTFATPLAAPLVAAVDAPSSTLKGLLQVNRVKKAVVPTAASGVAKIAESIPTTKMSKLKNIINEAEELRQKGFDGAPQQVLKEGEERIQSMWGKVDDVNKIEKTARRMSALGKKSIEQDIRKLGSETKQVVKEIPEAITKVASTQPEELEEWVPELEEWVPPVEETEEVIPPVETPTQVPTAQPTQRVTHAPKPASKPIESDYVPFKPTEYEEYKPVDYRERARKRIEEANAKFGVK